jgi:hypothetical protein
MLLLARSRLNRRDFLKWTAALAGASLLAACRPKENLFMSADQWAFCLHDFQLEGVWGHDHKYRSFPKKKAAPETVTTFQKEHFVSLTPEWQWYWYRNLVYCAFGHFDETKLTEGQTQNMYKAWLWLTKGTEVVTNRHGPETHWEVITGQSPNEGHDYIAHDGLLAGGNIVKITGEKIRKGGQILYPFESLDGSKPPPDINDVNVVTRPDLFQRATICHFEQFADRTFRVDPFPQLENFNAHTVFLNISTGQNYVPADRIKLLGSYQTPNPYNPQREMNFAK